MNIRRGTDGLRQFVVLGWPEEWAESSQDLIQWCEELGLEWSNINDLWFEDSEEGKLVASTPTQPNIIKVKITVGEWRKVNLVEVIHGRTFITEVQGFVYDDGTGFAGCPYCGDMGDRCRCGVNE